MAESDDRDRGPVSRGDVARYPLFAVAAVLLGAFLANFDSRLTSVGLPDLRGAFSLSFDEGAWLSTAAIGSQIFVAPAVAWLATVFGLRRVLGIPSLVYAVVSLTIPFVRDYTTLIALSIAHGMLLGTFVPATLMIILRNLPIRWWLPAIAMYSIRVGFALDSSSSLVGFYVEHLGWQWLYWQGVVIAPLMGLMVYLGTPKEPVNRDLLHHADWGGMLLLGAGVSMVYAGLDQGNRLDWLSSGTVMALLIGGGLLIVAFMINEMVARRPWAHFNVLFSRNIGLSLVVILLYTLTSLSNSSLVPNFLGTVGALRPEQSGVLLFTYGALPMFVLVPISILLLRHLDPRIVVVLGFSAFAAANLWGTQLSHVWAREDFVGIVLLTSIGQAFTLLPIIIMALSNSDPSRATAFAAYIQIMRLGGAEIGVALMGTWLRVREQIHSNYLGQHVQNGNIDVVNLLKRLAGEFSGDGIGTATGRAVGTLAALVQREANTLAYIDGFWLCFWLAILALVLVAFITRAPQGPLSPAPLGLVKSAMRRLGATAS
ncbi:MULTISPECIES: MFS transporter [Bradyrhizobium]|jgi:MFS transporter, DHA2 family, multidrug resistance protein|uniref:MFS transporter n=1 Tax=Bradyrhizobium TaxID=374 RepID=UPI0004876B8C|nr:MULTISPECIES: MFS transporter [Bradyrhizobium]MCS3445046.1 DHA2 family multidrug resistance protein [Bradyrhizobium elkanii]MCS3563823.1 DHA2 family multidrug resistance protein [Bradyrhizobium elkanii]MCW2146342.1 DHA2 family multidrug resistance protein [Bradyrhizobium elkanii]MCW2354585.1 DHA2 family multidrug resistance protein [Bradyrhizobium elkanii]MCW2379172.1 DHA2 family multidrug resistance protein [Bradyrhizobium elkanii]